MEAYHSNQLRFNLDVPYSLNNLAQRHKKPKPIVIEKCKSGNDLPAAGQLEQELRGKLLNVSLDALKDAQFLAQRNLKNKKYEELRRHLEESQENYEEPALVQARSAPHKTQVIKTRSDKKQKTRQKPPTHKHLPAAGSSPPVRDRNRVNRPGPTDRSAQHKTRSPIKKRNNGTAKSPVRPCRSVPGFTFEKISTQQVPNIHRLQLNRLVNVSDIEKETLLEMDSELRKTQSNPSHTPNKSSTRRKVMTGGYGTSRIERVYRQPVVPEETTTKNKTRRKQQKKPRGFIRSSPHVNFSRSPTRRPQSSSYTDKYQQASRYSEQQVFNDEFSTDIDQELTEDKPARGVEELGDAAGPLRDRRLLKEYVRTVALAKQYREKGLAGIPSDLIDCIEKEARARLEPLIQQAEALNRTLRHATHQTSPPTMPEEVLKALYMDDPLKSIAMTDDTLNTSTNVEDSTIDGSNESITASSEKLTEVMAMLSRLDEMEIENIQIRQRWMTAKTFDFSVDQLKLDQLDITGDEGNQEFNNPKPVLLIKSKSYDDKTHKTSSNIKSNKKITTFKKTKVKTKKTPKKQISVPAKKISSINEGKEKFNEHLKDTGHETNSSFDPWKFATETADSIAQTCIDEVIDEVHAAGDELVGTIYKEEFQSTKELSPTPPPSSNIITVSASTSDQPSGSGTHV